MSTKILKWAGWSAVVLLLLTTSAIAAYKYDTLACLFVDYSKFVQIDKNVYVSPDTTAQNRTELLSLIAQAKARVIAVYGQYSATPVIIAGRNMNSLGIFASNEYASTKFLPGRAYVVLGPKGHNIDVVAHELVHAQIFEHIGFWGRTLKLPVWFDEGAAMQVDYREKYNLIGIENVKLVGSELQYTWQFFQGDDKQLTHHYARAKNEVHRWLRKVGHKGIIVLLNRIKQGESFDHVYATLYKES